MGSRLFAFGLAMLCVGMIIGLVVPGLANSIHDNAQTVYLEIRAWLG